MRVTEKGSVACMCWVALVCGVITWYRSRLEICAVKMTKAHRIERQSKPFGFADHCAAAVASTHTQLGAPPSSSFVVLLFACGYSMEKLMCFAQASYSVTTFSSSPWCQFEQPLRLLPSQKVSPWKQFLERWWTDVRLRWVCYYRVKGRPHYKSGVSFGLETCTAFYLFTCHVPAVFSQWAQPIRAQSKPQSVLQTLISATAHKAANQSKARREDAAGGRSDAILTSNWKSSHSLFPIKRLCQARESTGGMEREMKGETQRGGRQTESELVEKWEQKVRAVGVWESERRGGEGKNTCQPSRSERWVL